MDNPIVQFIWSNTKWLYTVFYEIDIIYLDLWSFVHLWSGAVVFAMLTAFKFRKRWLKLFICLAGYEAIENPILIAIMNVFEPEKIADVLTDIWVGMLGGLLIYLYFKWSGSMKSVRFAGMFLSSLTIAFLWAGWYGAIYSNALYMDWLELGIMFILGLGVIALFQYFKRKINNAAALASSAGVYFATLAVVAGRTVPVFYVFAPFLFIALYITFTRLFEKYQLEENKLVTNEFKAESYI